MRLEFIACAGFSFQRGIRNIFFSLANYSVVRCSKKQHFYFLHKAFYMVHKYIAHIYTLYALAFSPRHYTQPVFLYKAVTTCPAMCCLYYYYLIPKMKLCLIFLLFFPRLLNEMSFCVQFFFATATVSHLLFYATRKSYNCKNSEPGASSSDSFFLLKCLQLVTRITLKG